ncbi:hypothetical protein C8035_v003709 [Colletotrichum spinosum]|uniref:Carbohydrate-binding module family 19 domain-containing protein n=1 Tax=Colletotrichum spinosum TaxID=1347390 RepID=A0A4R8PWP8_9PEZI|nr:hypothetical protein C8035_v003709 [Colletotrichum spinosum]
MRSTAGPVRRGGRLSVKAISRASGANIAYASRSLPRDWNTTYTSPITIDASSTIVPSTELPTSVNTVNLQQEQDDTTPSPIFVTIDESTGSIPTATQTQPRSLSVSAESTIEPTTSGVFLPPPFSTISIPPSLSPTSNADETFPSTTAPKSNINPPPLSSSLQNSSAIVTVPESTSGRGPTQPIASSATTIAAPLQSSLSFEFSVPRQPSVSTQTAYQSTGVALPPSSTATAESSSPAGDISTTTTAPLAPGTPSSTIRKEQSSDEAVSSSATLKITGVPNNQVPTINTALPAATATVSPAIAASNLASAKSFNALFATLSAQSACINGQVACVNSNMAKCGAAGAFALEACGTGESCFALPMNTTEGVLVSCFDTAVANNILGESSSAPAPPASWTASELTVTVRPTTVVVSTVLYTPPSHPTTSPEDSVVTVSSTVLFTPPPPTSSKPRSTKTVIITQTIQPEPVSSTAVEEKPSTTSSQTSTRRQASTFVTKTSPRSTATITVTDTLILDPIPTTVPTVLMAQATGGLRTVTITQRELVTTTITEKEMETITSTVTTTR